MDVTIKRHRLLPAAMNASQLALWLTNNAKETFTHEVKTTFTTEELQNFEHESSLKGREMNRLLDMLAEAGRAIKKGTDEAITFTIPATLGTKMLETHRRENDDFIERGYAKEDKQIFGLPCADSFNMYYFDMEGNCIYERTRPLGAKEKHDLLGWQGQTKPTIIDGVRAEDGEVIDEQENSYAKLRKAS